MPPRKQIDFSKYHDKKAEPKLVIPEVRITPHIRIREGLWEHIAQGRLTPHDLCVYLTLHRHAKWGTGICITSAASIAGNWGGQLKLNTVQACLGRLRDNGYIKYPEGTGKRGVYPVLIDKYEPQVGPCKGWSLNAAASDDYENPVYDYISGTPYGDAYGASAVDHAVRVWRVSGAPYGVSTGDWVVRQPLQAVIQLSSQTLQARQAGQASQATQDDVCSASQMTPSLTGVSTGKDSTGEYPCPHPECEAVAFPDTFAGMNAHLRSVHHQTLVRGSDGLLTLAPFQEHLVASFNIEGGDELA